MKTKPFREYIPHAVAALLVLAALVGGLVVFDALPGGDSTEPMNESTVE